MDINCPLPNGPPDDAKRNHFGQQSLKKQQKLPKTELNAKQHRKGFSWLMFVTAPRSIPNGIDEASRFIGRSLGFPRSSVVSTSRRAFSSRLHVSVVFRAAMQARPPESTGGTVFKDSAAMPPRPCRRGFLAAAAEMGWTFYTHTESIPCTWCRIVFPKR